MLETRELSPQILNEADPFPGPALTFNHPDDVLHSRGLSVEKKRAILAAWASDAHAVPNLPAMRQLESGAIVTIDAVLGALRALEASDETRSTMRPRRDARTRFGLRSRWRRASWRHGESDDGDNDPPPCPAAALPPGLELELRRRRDEAWHLAAA